MEKKQIERMVLSKILAAPRFRYITEVEKDELLEPGTAECLAKHSAVIIGSSASGTVFVGWDKVEK